MSLHVIGMITEAKLTKFERECEKLGWVYLGVKDKTVGYLDRNMNEHRLVLGDNIELVITS